MPSPLVPLSLDDANNVEVCKYDGGDCCESTCGVGYVVSSECGADHYDCLDSAASEFVAPSEDVDDDGGYSYYGEIVGLK